jgi:choice-of-anchor C domain-containing protein
MYHRAVLHLSLALAVALPLCANLLTNGSFESVEAGCANPGASFYSVFPTPGTQCITGWDVVSEDVHYIGTFWEAADGVRSIDLDGAVNSSGGVRQVFPTIAGLTYRVTFFMAGNPLNAPMVKPMRVSADGQSAEFTFDVTGKTQANMGWTPETWTFVADDQSAALTFQSLTQERGLLEGWGPALDDVSVIEVGGAAIPEPGTWVIMASGLLTLFLLPVRLGRACQRLARN